jgi:Bacterial membrane protein YfhO
VIAAAYLATAALLLLLAHRCARPLTRGVALALLLLPLVFTGRALLTGRIYAPVEMPYITQPLADHRADGRVPQVHNAVLADIAFQMIPWREAVREQVAARQWPLWNRFMNCGDVLAASMQPAVYSPFTWIALLFPAAVSFTFTGAITFFIAGLGAFLFARDALADDDVKALLAAVAWMFSAGVAMAVLWPLGFAWALFPFVLFATRRAVHERSIALLTVALVLLIVAGHPETLLHIVALASAYGLFELARARNRGRALGAAIAAGVLALLLTAIALLPFFEAMRVSAEYGVRQLFAAEEVPKATSPVSGHLFPFLPHRVASPPLVRAEAGSIVFALALTALLTVRRREVAFFGALALFALLAGVWPVANALHALPLFDHALNERLAFAAPLALAMLAIFGVRKRAAIAMLVWAVAIVIAWRNDSDQTRFLAELVPLLVAAAVVWFVRSDIAVPILIALVLIQRMLSDGALIPVHPRELAFPPLALLKPLDGIGEPFRVAPYGGTFITNTATMYRLEDVRGSTPMSLASYVRTYPLWAQRPGGGYQQVLDLKAPFLSMMNVRFSMQDVSDPIPPGWVDRGLEIYTRVLENERVLPRAFVPRHVVFGRTGAEELDEMAREADFANRAWVRAERKHERTNGPGRVTTSRRGNELTLLATMEQAGFVVISEAAWPGWRVWVDGKRVKPLLANHTFQAVYVPAGEHRVRMRYQPQSFVAGRMISGLTLVGLAAFALWRRRKSHGLSVAQSPGPSVRP